MGIFRKIIEGFIAPLDTEQEETLNKYINAYNLAVSKLTEEYVPNRKRAEFKELWGVAYNEVKRIRVPKRHELYASVQKFFHEYEHVDDRITASNSSFLVSEKHRCDSLLSDIDGKSLDDQQRTVVVTNEDRNLVIAGAGSGKTLTIAGKVKYLCDVKGVAPEDILLIAFTRKSAEEMSERIAHKLSLPVQATTFHKLGLDIITEADGKRPDVLDDLTDFVRGYFEERIVDDPRAVKNLIEYFSYYLKIPADLDKFASLGAAYEYEKGADFETLRGKYDRAKYLETLEEERNPERKTLQGEQVKSLQEVQINSNLVSELDSTDLLVGHSYFMGKGESDLCDILNHNIIPLLYEYFYDNRKKVAALLEKSISSSGAKIEVVNEKVGRLRVKEKVE